MDITSKEIKKGKKVKYLLVVFLSFMLHKGMEETYDYFFAKAFASDVCKKEYTDALNDKNEPAPLSRRFRCTEREMGIVHLLSYILMRPHFILNNTGKWYY
jgi:hypothetical protein